MKKFEELCCEAYNHLRRNSTKLVNLFLIMLSAGMPELKHKEEVRWLVSALRIHPHMLSDREAAKHFKQQISKAQKTFSRRIDNLAHNWKQMK